MDKLAETSGRLEQLKMLERILADEIDQRPGARDLASLAKQYRETIEEIENIEGVKSNNDAIGNILEKRNADGRSRPTRKNRATIRGQ